VTAHHGKVSEEKKWATVSEQRAVII